MSTESTTPATTTRDGNELGKRFRTLLNDILRCANHTDSRFAYLGEISKILADCSGCDAVVLETEERGAIFRCEARRTADETLVVRVDIAEIIRRTAEAHDPHSEVYLRRLCDDAVRRRLSTPPPFLTPYGSFFTSRLGSRPGGPTLTPCHDAHEFAAVALVPFVIDPNNSGRFFLKSKRGDCLREEEIEFYEGLAQTIGLSSAFRRTQRALRARVRELDCLHRMAQLADRPGRTLDALLQDIVQTLPAAWLYPDIAAAEITFDEFTYSTASLKGAKHTQTAMLLVRNEPRGTVTVAYMEEMPELDEGPFLREERSLIDAVAREVAMLIERWEVQKEQQTLQEQLRHADRLATIGQLAAGVAHELNEPLASILGFAQLGLKSPGLPDQVREDMERIVRSCLNARQVIRQLLIFARQVPSEKVLIDVNEVVEDTLYFLESRFTKEGIQVTRSLSPNLDRVAGDRGQLQQVFVNIVVNAVQAMPGGGRLTITTRKIDDSVAVIFQDTGMGMSVDVKEQIFLPFFTTKDVGHGTGLGLAVVHGIVTAHGGSIAVDSKPGSGARFEIRFPRAGTLEAMEHGDRGR